MQANIKIPNSREAFWRMADLTKATENYKIDQNLRSLQHLSLVQLRSVFVQYRYFTQYYITDLALLISKMPFGHLRSMLADILYEELGNGRSSAAHPALYDE